LEGRQSASFSCRCPAMSCHCLTHKPTTTRSQTSSSHHTFVLAVAHHSVRWQQRAVCEKDSQHPLHPHTKKTKSKSGTTFTPSTTTKRVTDKQTARWVQQHTADNRSGFAMAVFEMDCVHSASNTPISFSCWAVRFHFHALLLFPYHTHTHFSRILPR